LHCFLEILWKIKPPRSGDPGGEFCEPKWPYYTSLFLKDIVKPRASSSNLKSDESAPIQSNPIKWQNWW